jgi:hypothetical protein
MSGFAPRWIEKNKRLIAPMTATLGITDDGEMPELIGDEWAEFTPDDPEFEELAKRAVEEDDDRNKALDA